ncbi:FMNH2-utilizing oxygenase [Corynebacterium suranareeae]|uniref:FMNH2-utilizing oxygenase n=1 Tax=Corynebacterium suranareeae TaxID=2506452 RepID=A0A160PKY1_9CORY|nr:LLM class flavin-dependent oxidoreductase [Corynebacterium suranareeae]BAU94327.1 FMNH2-utilizing oxygenase [Corynebacterium suranareeae]
MSNNKQFIVGVALDATADITAENILNTQLATARLLDEHSFDFLTLNDSFETGFDALLTASFISTQTHQIGLIPTVTTTHTEPFHIATATATLDYTGRARGGWQAVPSLTQADAKAIGRRDVAEPGPAWNETEQVIDVVRKLWDSWEPDAEIRDARTGRFLDRNKLHYIDATLTDSVGEPYTVKGPSIVPHPPQGNPPVFVVAADEQSRAVALHTADVILVPADDADSAVALVTELESHTNRDVLVIPSIPLEVEQLRSSVEKLLDAGLRGLHLRPQRLAEDVDKLVSHAREFGEYRQGTSLRNRLGLPAVP